jgi:hypothetical protein
VGTIYTTRYWLALDEVYNVKGDTAQNNAGVEHTWGVRVVVFGPGPRSTSVSDWYNAIYVKVPFDPTNVNVVDGIDADDAGIPSWDYGYTDDWSMATEMVLAADGYKPRTMAGIDVKWSIYDVKDNPLTLLTNEAVTSVGNIIKVDGAAITPAKTATGKTDADGLSTIVVYSEVTGMTLTKAVADYAGNPYPQELFDHATFQKYSWYHNFDWDDQPTDEAFQAKTWISHTIGGAVGPITPAYQAPNIGEEKILTITLKDVYGNPVSGRAVEWFMQGVGFFQTDDAGDTSDPAVAANNHDFDTTDAAGKATVFVKSYDAGEQIVHAKVRDKGTGGAEGTFSTYTAEVQWFDVNIVTFDDITTHTLLNYKPFTDVPAIPFYDQNEALSSNAVNGSHTFTLNVYGLKLEYDPSVDEPDGQTSFIDSDAAGHSYDGILDSKDAAYFGGILMWPSDFNFVQLFEQKLKLIYDYKLGALPFDYDHDGIIEAVSSAFYDADSDGVFDPPADYYYDERGTFQVKVNGAWLTLSFEGAYVNYDYNEDGLLEPFSGLPGIYLPLAGKTATFSKANETAVNLSNLGAVFNGVDTASVGSFTPTSAVTDAAGKATVTVSSTAKGPETIKAVVDWAGNPHNGPQLLSAYAKKNWQAGTVGAASDVTIEIWIDGVKVATNKAGELASGDKAAWTVDPITNNLDLNSAHVEVHVLDAFGNNLPDYEVVYLLEDITGWLGGSQNAANTYIPFAYLADLDPLNMLPVNSPDALPYDQNGSAPDSDEPTPGSDPYAYMVGAGGTPAFFFNQWLGSEKPWDSGEPGIPKWWTRTPGLPFDDYFDAIDGVAFATNWPWTFIDPVWEYSGFDGTLENGNLQVDALAPLEVGLATDGAKAWTLDGYAHPVREQGLGTDEVIPNLLTGSNIDIQLSDAGVGFANALGIHVKSILRVMVYAPADGLVKEGSYIWSTQVHQVWETPVPTTITLTPATDYAIAGLENQSVVATVKDQFGNVLPNVDVSFRGTVLEGSQGLDVSPLVPVDYTVDVTPVTNPVTTDASGQAAVTWGQPVGGWGVESVVAFLDADNDGFADTTEVKSTPSIIQWIYMDDEGDPGNLVAAFNAEQKVRVNAGDTQITPGDWNGMTVRAWLNPGGNVAGALASALYNSGIDNFISTNLHTWIDGEAFFVSAGTPTAVVKSNTDGIPNWVYDIVDADD